MAGVVGHHLLGQAPREAVNVREARSAAQRADHVDAARAGGHRVRGEPEVAQPVAGGPRGGAHLGEAAARRIEVERQAIGLERLLGPGQPGVHRHHVLARQVHERRGVLRPARG